MLRVIQDTETPTEVAEKTPEIFSLNFEQLKSLYVPMNEMAPTERAKLLWGLPKAPALKEWLNNNGQKKSVTAELIADAVALTLLETMVGPGEQEDLKSTKIFKLSSLPNLVVTFGAYLALIESEGNIVGVLSSTSKSRPAKPTDPRDIALEQKYSESAKKTGARMSLTEVPGIYAVTTDSGYVEDYNRPLTLLTSLMEMPKN
jgi:hypothetical protein